MTVNELIERLVTLSSEGWGDDEVVFDSNHFIVTDAYGISTEFGNGETEDVVCLR